MRSSVALSVVQANTKNATWYDISNVFLCKITHLETSDKFLITESMPQTSTVTSAMHPMHGFNHSLKEVHQRFKPIMNFMLSHVLLMSIKDLN